MIPDMETFEWVKSFVNHIKYQGKPLSRRQQEEFLLTGQLPEGAEYPAVMDPETWGHGSRTQQAMLFSGSGRTMGVASGPYAIANGNENFYARQIRPKP